MEKITAGYVAYNGYVFSKLDAEYYNQECERAAAFPTDWNLDNKHRVFCIIIGMTGKETEQ